ncbi:hypothetical protein RAD15_31155 [Bradyrhizobium sp. 14AA]
MRSLASFLSSLALAAILILNSAALAVGQERPQARREWYSLSGGRTEFEVSDPALLPSRLALAARQTGCRYEEGIKQAPARFMKLGDRRLAILFCSGIAGSDQMFDLSMPEDPRPIEFPILAQPEGFATTLRPGGITWDKDTRLLRAHSPGSDFLPTVVLRHVYRYDENQSGSPFVIIRIEVEHAPGANEWSTIWDAQRWLIPVPPK